MALISRLGKSLARKNITAGDSRALLGIAGAAVVGQGAVSGFRAGSGGDLSGGLYEATTGVADYDNYVFGTDVGFTGLAAPLPGPGVGGRAAVGAVGGGAAGAAIGGVLGRRFFGGAVVGSTIGAATSAWSGGGQRGRATRSMLTPGGDQFYGMFGKFNDPEYQNKMPNVNGSIVFGQYNSRGR